MVIEASLYRLRPDTIYLHHNFFGNPKPKPVAQKKPVKTADDKSAKKLSKQDSLKKANQVDSVYLTKKIELSDTTRVRILSAFHHTKIFKSDLQGKSDSAFYSTSDSTIRLYVNPIIWTQGSQLSGDTIHLQMKNKKFDNMELFPNAFTVNIEKDDSLHFNQVAGKKMRGFFKNDKLDRMFIDGNAETIYFSRDSGKISGIQRSLSSRISINFQDSKVTNLIFMGKPEHRYGPLDKFTDDEKILKGFIWKPKERPVSKESIIPSFNKNAATKNSKGKPTGAGKIPVKKPVDLKAGKDTSAIKPDNLSIPPIKSARDTIIKSTKDSTIKVPSKKLPDVKVGKDSTIDKPKIKMSKDTSRN